MTEIVNPGQAARLLGVTNQTVRRYVELGLLSATKTAGGHRRIERESLDRLMAARTKVGPNVSVIEHS